MNANANILRAAVAGLALLTLAGAQHAVAEPTESVELSWDWLPTSADAFLDGAVGNQCQGGTYALTQTELEDLFPLLATSHTASKVNLALLSAVSGCTKHCTCGACLVIDGQVACTACYACCDPGDKCDSDCSSDIAHQIVTSSCDCIPQPPGNGTKPPGNGTRLLDNLVDYDTGGRVADFATVSTPLAFLSLGRFFG